MSELASVKAILRKLKPQLLQKFGVTNIGYFDCFIDHHHNAHCEINILVELERPLGWDFFSLKEFLEKRLGMAIDICTPKALKPALRDEIMEHTIFA